MKFLLIYVPNLRFSFEEDWCTSTIGENFRLSSGLTPSTKEKAYFNNGIIPWINSGELKNKYISLLGSGENHQKVSVGNSQF